MLKDEVIIQLYIPKFTASKVGLQKMDLEDFDPPVEVLGISSLKDAG